MNGVFEKLLTEAVAGVRYGEGHALEVPEGSWKLEVGSQKGEGEGLRVFEGVPVEVHVVAMKMEEEESGEEEKEPGENLSAVEEEARMVAGRIRELMEEGAWGDVEGWGGEEIGVSGYCDFDADDEEQGDDFYAGAGGGGDTGACGFVDRVF